jgi:glycosyltransferase involved in cell wall biosynthesis
VRIANRRGLYSELSAGHLAIQRAAYACAHAIVANSKASAAQLRAERVPDRKVTVVPNGLDAGAFTVAAPTRPRRHVITVANLRPEKGHVVLVDAAVHVLSRFPDARFSVVGEGRERAAIEARLTERGVSYAFRLLGERQDVPSLLAEADLAVLPSLTESLPNAVLEAMAAGLPVVASQVGGVPEVVDHGGTGLLVAAGDAHALADAICAVMAEPLLATRMGLAARAMVQRRFSYDRMVSAIEGLYRRELARRGVVRSDRAA